MKDDEASTPRQFDEIFHLSFAFRGIALPAHQHYGSIKRPALSRRQLRSRFQFGVRSGRRMSLWVAVVRANVSFAMDVLTVVRNLFRVSFDPALHFVSDLC